MIYAMNFVENRVDLKCVIWSWSLSLFFTVVILISEGRVLYTGACCSTHSV